LAAGPLTYDFADTRTLPRQLAPSPKNITGQHITGIRYDKYGQMDYFQFLMVNESVRRGAMDEYQ